MRWTKSGKGKKGKVKNYEGNVLYNSGSFQRGIGRNRTRGSGDARIRDRENVSTTARRMTEGIRPKMPMIPYFSLRRVRKIRVGH